MNRRINPRLLTGVSKKKISRIIDYSFFCSLLHQILTLYPHRESKYTPAYVLYYLLRILKYSLPYKGLEIPDEAPDHHHSTILKRIQRWGKAGIPKIIHARLLEKYSKEYLQNLDFLNLFIDSSNIRNKNGVDLVSYSSKDKGKKNSKISLVVDENRFPIEIQLDTAKVHDGKIAESLIDKLDNNENLINKIYLIGDKGYVKSKKLWIGKRQINLIFPYRSNQRYINSKKERIKLNKRHNVENSFATMKQYRRTSTRYEKNSSRFLEYIYWAFILIGMNIMKNLEESNRSGEDYSQQEKRRKNSKVKIKP